MGRPHRSSTSGCTCSGCEQRAWKVSLTPPPSTYTDTHTRHTQAHLHPVCSEVHEHWADSQRYHDLRSAPVRQHFTRVHQEIVPLRVCACVGECTNVPVRRADMQGKGQRA